MYIIRKKDDNGKWFPLVEKVSMCSGQICSTTSMSSPRIGVAAVASGRSFLVFGGYDESHNVVLSSYGEYDPTADRQAECHRLHPA